VTATLIAGFGLLVPAWLNGHNPSLPTIVRPLALFIVIPEILLSEWNWHFTEAAIALPTLLFFAWQPRLFRGETKIPTRSFVLFAAAASLNLVWFLKGWRYGIDFQGIEYTRAVAVINTIWALVVGLAFTQSRNGLRSFRFNLFLHWMLFAWLAWYAFPWLGELP